MATLWGTDRIFVRDLLFGTTDDDFLYGLGGNDELYGGAGNDYLDGGKGADTMAGGSGDDKYVVDNAGDLVVEQPGEGYDTVYSSISYALPDGVEELQLTGVAATSGTGNALNNKLYGND